MNKQKLQFNFAFKNQAPSPITFSNPIDIISTNEIRAIDECLQKVQAYLDKGYYLAGYVSYEATYALQQINIETPNNKMPLIWFGVFPSYEEAALDTPEEDSFIIGDWQLQVPKAKYLEDINTILNRINTTNIKEVNYTVPFATNFTGSAYTYYQQLQKAQEANFNAYLDLDDFQILSASPELFFQVANNKVTVRPMKGTVKRGITYEADIAQYNWLANSEKNKLENYLTTKLMAEELEAIAKQRSIHISNAYQIEKYPTVYQMTSTITGNILPNKNMTDIFKALFPCSSIAGVPKSETIAFISQLETKPREVYCGAIGFFTPNDEAVFNVPIRTVFIEKATEKAIYGAGGGITEQSKAEEEYKEVLAKTNVLRFQQPVFELLETFGLKNGDYIVYDQHIERLKSAANYFNFLLPLKTIETALQDIKGKHHKDNWRVRLVVDKQGDFQLTVAPLIDAEDRKVRLAKSPIKKENRFLYFKTTYRNMYEIYQDNNIFDTLLWNEQEEITEFTIGNLVISLNGKKITPPVSAGLLNGTFRQQLIKDGVIEEATILKEDLKKADKIWLINSVREWVEVELIHN